MLGGGEAKAVITDAGGRMILPGCGPVVLNAGQAGYFRSVYTPGGLKALTGRLGELSADDQLGLINDERALAYAGDETMGGFLGLGPKLDGKTDPIIWSQLAKSLADLDRIYSDQPGQPAYRAYVRRVLAPELARVGWDETPGEDANVAIMRASLLSALGQVGDPAVLAEARHRFLTFLFSSNDHALSAATRRTVLAIIAQHADAADWDQLHQMAKGARSEVERKEFYSLLGRTEDPALAQKALDLAISGEPPPTVAPNVIDSVAIRYPGLALDFSAAHWAVISQLMEPDSRTQYVADLVGRGADPALIAKLDAFAEKYVPASAQGEVRRADAQIAYRAPDPQKPPAGRRPLADGGRLLSDDLRHARPPHCPRRGAHVRPGRRLRRDAADGGRGRSPRRLRPTPADAGDRGPRCGRGRQSGLWPAGGALYRRQRLGRFRPPLRRPPGRPGRADRGGRLAGLFPERSFAQGRRRGPGRVDRPLYAVCGVCGRWCWPAIPMAATTCR